VSTSARNDPLSFYACTIASFLEGSVSTYVENLHPLFAKDAETERWLRDTWLPEEEEHGRLTRAYVASTWPDFDWESAYGIFFDQYKPQCASARLRPTAGLEALARCVTETEATMMYRCIASYTPDSCLRNLFERLSKDEIRHYRYFRALHERLQQREDVSLLRRLQTVVERSRLVRDEDIALAFAPMNNAWRGAPPFEPWTYHDFLKAAAMAMKLHFPFRQARRMLFRPLQIGGPLEWLAALVASAVVARLFTRYA